MTVGILRISILVEGSQSLKEKRMVLSSLTARLRQSFNVSVAPIADQDKWQKATLAVVGVAAGQAAMHHVLSDVVNCIDRMHRVGIIDHEIELI